MLHEIGHPDRIPEYIERAKDKNDPFRLMGFGHRVYKNYDPRASVMQKTVREVFAALKVNDPVFDVALQLEEMALNDPYFIEKKLFPNVDFYSGIILSAIGFPTSMFTALFALARHRWLGCPVERDDFRSRPAHWTSASALHRTQAPRICGDRRPLDRVQHLTNSERERRTLPFYFCRAGSVRVKVVPLPTWLSTVRLPSMASASRREMNSPRPLPPSPERPSRSNFSKIFA